MGVGGLFSNQMGYDAYYSADVNFHVVVHGYMFGAASPEGFRLPQHYLKDSPSKVFPPRGLDSGTLFLRGLP